MPAKAAARTNRIAENRSGDSDSRSRPSETQHASAIGSAFLHERVATQFNRRAVRLEQLLCVYANDREPVSNASVMLHGVSPSGTALPAQSLASAGDGMYSAAVTLSEPGRWKLQVMSVVPSALVELDFDATQTATTTTTLPRSDDGQVQTLIGATGNDGGAGFLPAGLIVAGAVLGGGTAVLYVHRRRRSRS